MPWIYEHENSARATPLLSDAALRFVVARHAHVSSVGALTARLGDSTSSWSLRRSTREMPVPTVGAKQGGDDGGGSRGRSVYSLFMYIGNAAGLFQFMAPVRYSTQATGTSASPA